MEVLSRWLIFIDNFEWYLLSESLPYCCCLEKYPLLPDNHSHVSRLFGHLQSGLTSSGRSGPNSPDRGKRALQPFRDKGEEFHDFNQAIIVSVELAWISLSSVDSILSLDTALSRFLRKILSSQHFQRLERVNHVIISPI